jgi:hypothetical protein
VPQKSKQKKAPELLVHRWWIPGKGQWLMRVGKNSLRSNICHPDRNTIIRFRLRHTGNDGQKQNPDASFTTDAYSLDNFSNGTR